MGSGYRGRDGGWRTLVGTRLVGTSRCPRAADTLAPLSRGTGNMWVPRSMVPLFDLYTWITWYRVLLQ